MQKNKRNLWDTLYKPSGLDPMVISKCLIIWISLSDHAISINYNQWKKLDEYSRWDQRQVEYNVIEEWREWIKSMRYTEESLYETREEAMEFIYERAKEVLWIEDEKKNESN